MKPLTAFALAALLLVAIHFWRIRKDGGLYAHHSEPEAAMTTVSVRPPL